MTILKRIRRQKWILIGVLISSVTGFLFNFDQFLFFLKSNPNIYGKINGKNISKQEFDALHNLMSIQSADEVSLEKTWKYLIKNKLISDQFNKSGLQLTEKNFWRFTQYSSILTKNSSLYDKTRNFNFNKLKTQIQELKENLKIDKNSELLYNYWLQQRYLAESQIKEKLYFTTLVKGLLTNTKEAKFFQKRIIENAQIDFLLINYEKYNNKNKISVTDKDLEQYINIHPNRFKIDSSVGLKYVLFKNIPTSKDDSIIYKKIQTYAQGGVVFDEKGKIIDSVKGFNKIGISEVKNFINDYSDEKFNLQYFPRKNQPIPIQNWLKTAKIGNTFGPYLIENFYVVSKLVDKKFIDSISSRHILISYKKLLIKSKRTKKKAKIIADSILTLLSKDSSKFRELVSLSDDVSSVKQGGKLGWTITGGENFVPEFQNFLEKNKKGKLGLIETQFGYHIINILDKKKIGNSYYVAHLKKDRRPTIKTTTEIENKAFSFVRKIENKSEKYFEEIAKKNKFQVINSKKNTRFSFNFNGINLNHSENEEIINWVFDLKRNLGDTNIFTTSRQDYIVLIINAINKKGLATPKMVRPEIELVVRNKKIAKILVKKINNSNLFLNELAQKFKVEKKSSIINFQNPIIKGVGIEPNVAGVAFGIKHNIVSKAIEGSSGVFVIIKKNIIKNSVQINLLQLKKRIIEKYQQIGPYQILSGLENQAHIKDFRIEAI